MKSTTIRYLEHGGLEIVQVDVPDPGPGEVQVRHTACGICVWDLNTYRNGTAAPYAAPPGHEGIGHVVRVGAGVEGLAEGDRVAGGGFAELQNLRASQVYRLPASTLPDELWMVEPVSCIVTGIDHCKLLIGDRVAVVGAGFMGMLIIQGLARSFAERLIVFDIVDERLQLAKEYGASEVVNSAGDIEGKIAEIAALGIDTVVDTTGSQAGFALSNRLVKRGGRINNFGWIHGVVSFVGDDWHTRGYTIVNSSPAAKLRDTFPVAIRLIDSGLIKLDRVVTHVVPLADAATLMGDAVRGAARGYIKGVVRVAS
jgi:threonine dehydrogenase-like Zn-dependent dehydrogenase